MERDGCSREIDNELVCGGCGDPFCGEHLLIGKHSWICSECISSEQEDIFFEKIEELSKEFGYTIDAIETYDGAMRVDFVLAKLR